MIADAMRCDHRHRGAKTSAAHPAIASVLDALNRVSGCIVTPKLGAVVYANQSRAILGHLLYTIGRVRDIYACVLVRAGALAFFLSFLLPDNSGDKWLLLSGSQSS
jgi:hypothetical protein